MQIQSMSKRPKTTADLTEVTGVLVKFMCLIQLLRILNALEMERENEAAKINTQCNRRQKWERECTDYKPAMHIIHCI